MPVLTAIDVLGVQRFIFQSNRLRDVVAGSYLVHWSTSVDGALKGLVAPDKVLLAGGGNAIVEVESLEEARSFAARYTRRLHDEAPGLEAVVVPWPYDQGGLARALQDIQVELARAKTERKPSAATLGLSVTASCRETGFAATGFDAVEPTVPLSKGILERRKRRKEATSHWVEYLKDFAGFAFPMELDHLGRTIGDTSLIGVVHVDGNGVGQRIKEWLKKASENGEEDDTVRQQYRQWSEAIDQLGRKALQAVVERICRSVQKTVEGRTEKVEIVGRPAQLGFELKKVDDAWMLALRPILLGGDDLTFVCDGRIALDLAETALAVFSESDVPHLGRITASAGVAVVRVHATFAKAYELAEALCASAKGMLRQKNVSGCALDWHIGTSRPGESVEVIRKRQYRANGYDLTCRPYRLGFAKDEAETWRWLSGTLLHDEEAGLRKAAWATRRNKVKAFAELARQGPECVQEALQAWRVADKNLKFPPPMEDNGFFAGTRTPLIDALELLDLHLELAVGDDNRDNEGERP